MADTGSYDSLYMTAGFVVGPVRPIAVVCGPQVPHVWWLGFATTDQVVTEVPDSSGEVGLVSWVRMTQAPAMQWSRLGVIIGVTMLTHGVLSRDTSEGINTPRLCRT